MPLLKNISRENIRMPIPFIIGAIAAGAAVAGIAKTKCKESSVTIPKAEISDTEKQSRIQYLHEKVPELRELAELPKVYKKTILELFDSNPRLFVSKDVASVFEMNIWFEDDESVEEWRTKLEKEVQDNLEILTEMCNGFSEALTDASVSDDEFLKAVDTLVNTQEGKTSMSELYDGTYGKLLEKPLNKVKELYSY